MPTIAAVANESSMLTLGLLGTFSFGLSGAIAACRRGLDVFGVVVIALVVSLTGGIVRDVLIGVAPTAIRNWMYLATATGGGLLCFLLWQRLTGVGLYLRVTDAAGLSLFCVVGASTALHAGMAPAPATLVGLISGIGGGVLRDLLFSELPAVLHTGLYAVPGLLGASVVTITDAIGLHSAWWLAAGALACFTLWAAGQRWHLSLPHAGPSDASTPDRNENPDRRE
jgi:uncharacterized membrane protein YeiH